MLHTAVLSSNIRSFRTAKGLSQSELAARLGISTQSVSKWETGHSLPDLDNLCLLADIFGVSLDLLCGNTAEKKRAYIGIDGGGTKTAFLMFTEDGEVLQEVTLGASNPNTVGIDETLRILKTGINRLLSEHPFVVGIYVGGSGLLTGKYKSAVRDALLHDYPQAKIKCDSDILNVIAASGNDESCIAAICGTGSVVFIREGERLSRLAGWGYLLSDGGSGYDLGRDTLAAALAASEGFGESTLLLSLVEERLGAPVSDVIGTVYKNDQSYIASFAPLVFTAKERGDGVATAIIERNAAAFARVINRAARALPASRRVILSGGLIENHAEFGKALRRHLDPRLSAVLPRLPQIAGACLLCAAMCRCDTAAVERGLTAYFQRQEEKQC